MDSASQDGGEGLKALALDSHPSATLIISPKGALDYANVAARKLFGLTEGGPLPCFVELWQEPAGTVERVLSHVLGSSNWVPLQFRHPGKGGDVTVIELRGRALRRDGQLFALVTTDETRRDAFIAQRRHIQALNQQLAALRRSESRLREALEQGRLLHRELVHRVKNNLAVLSALVRGQARNSRDPEVGRALGEVRSRITALGLVHDLLDRHDEIDQVDCAELLTGLMEQIGSAVSSDRVQLVLDVQSRRLQVAEATPLALIANELVTNALKHAFPESRPGRITVALRHQPNAGLTLEIRDDGIGILDVESSRQGHGSAIARALADQMGGVLICDTSEGTSWRLTVPDRPCPTEIFREKEQP